MTSDSLRKIAFTLKTPVTGSTSVIAWLQQLEIRIELVNSLLIAPAPKALWGRTTKELRGMVVESRNSPAKRPWWVYAIFGTLFIALFAGLQWGPSRWQTAWAIVSAGEREQAYGVFASHPRGSDQC